MAAISYNMLTIERALNGKYANDNLYERSNLYAIVNCQGIYGAPPTTPVEAVLPYKANVGETNET